MYLVVVSICDGIGLDSSFLHLKEDSDCQDRLSILSTQLHQHPVADLKRTKETGDRSERGHRRNGGDKRNIFIKNLILNESKLESASYCSMSAYLQNSQRIMGKDELIREMFVSLYLIRGLQLFGLHLPEDVVGGAQGSNL